MTEQEYDLKDLFPDIKPVKKPPILFTLNGVGVSMYGNRDEHPETGSYIKTHFICFLFVPLVALGAYRVIDTDSASSGTPKQPDRPSEPSN